tara:strand:- start:323 stop:907 length:585 start_codon:yes stop_codon:yes gene_type:complete
MDIHNLPKEALFILLLQLDPRELKTVALSSNKKIREICSSKYFQEIYKPKHRDWYICNEIWNSETMIFILYGNSYEKGKKIVDLFNLEFGYMNEFPLPFLEQGHIGGGYYRRTMNVDLMMSDHFFIRKNNLDNLDGGKIKELVHGDIFTLADRMLGITRNSRRRKLLILTQKDPSNTIFNTEAGLRARTKCISI